MAIQLINLTFNPDGSFAQTTQKGIITFEYDDCGRNDICYNRVKIKQYDRNFFCECDFNEDIIVREERNYAATTPIKFTLFGKHFSGLEFDATFEGCCVHVTSSNLDCVFSIAIAMLLIVTSYKKVYNCDALVIPDAIAVYENLITRSQFCKEYNEYSRVESIEWLRVSLQCLLTMINQKEKISNIEVKDYNEATHLQNFIRYIKRLFNRQLEVYAHDSHWSGSELSWLKFSDE